MLSASREAEPGEAIVQRQAEESTKRQEAELSTSRGEASPGQAASVSMEEKLAAMLATSREEGAEQDAAREIDAGAAPPPSFGRGM